jgi:hypothetical protein
MRPGSVAGVRPRSAEGRFAHTATAGQRLVRSVGAVLLFVPATILLSSVLIEAEPALGDLDLNHNDGTGYYREETMVIFLQEIFRRLGGGLAAATDADEAMQPCGNLLSDVIEHVLDETDPRLRALPGYARRLKEPVAVVLRYIEDLVEAVPGDLLCSRSVFASDPRINAFFVSPQHLQEVFSQSAEVRDLFAAHPDAGECWALLCMHRVERRQLGMALVGDAVHGDVMQTTVSFTDHQIVSPGCTEAEARRSLKCCIFNGLLSYVRATASAAKSRSVELETRRKALHTRLRQPAEQQGSDASREALQAEIERLEGELGAEDLRLVSLEERLAFVAQVLGNPAQYLSSSTCSVRLSRLGIKLEGDSADVGYEIPLSEIRIASQAPRVGALVRFPRQELIPQLDLLARADLFLAL